MAVPNMRGDDPQAPPQLLIGISAMTMSELPSWSAAPKGELTDQDTLQAVKAAGFDGVQTYDPRVASAALSCGLAVTGLARVDAPDQARPVAQMSKEAGHNAITLHVGHGFETDDEIRRLVEAIVEASIYEGHPLYIETHRATITQDMKRTLDIVAAVPSVRFNGDFSHWYVGQEMPYGDVNNKIERIAQVLERTRFIHGRVSTNGAIQAPVGTTEELGHLAAYRRLWTGSFEGFLRDASQGDVAGFFPELLNVRTGYARLISVVSGEAREETDRWFEALKLVEIARECWRDAQAAV